MVFTGSVLVCIYGTFIFVGANVLPQCAGLPSRDNEAENCVSFEKYIDIDDDIDNDDYGKIINELVSSIRHKLTCVYIEYIQTGLRMCTV